MNVHNGRVNIVLAAIQVCQRGCERLVAERLLHDHDVVSRASQHVRSEALAKAVRGDGVPEPSSSRRRLEYQTRGLGREVAAAFPGRQKWLGRARKGTPGFSVIDLGGVKELLLILLCTGYKGTNTWSRVPS